MIYFDNSATTRVFDDSSAVAVKYMTNDYFNPSGAYALAAGVEKDVALAKRRLLSALGLQQGSIIYTSGATESNNLAIFGSIASMRGKGTIIVGGAEHPSVFEAIHSLEKQGFRIVNAPITSDGCIDIAKLSSIVTPDVKLVSVMHVNNEVGAINDIAAIRSLLKTIAPEALLHVDGVQGFLKVPFSAKLCDMYSISGHKFHAPKGVGALYVAKGVKITAQHIGGGQEDNLRSGTENVPGIMAMDKAIEIYISNQNNFIKSMRRVKYELAKRLTNMPDVVINGPVPTVEWIDDGSAAESAGAPHILNVSFMGVRGEVLLHALEEKNVIVSTGSACSAHKRGGNRILDSMGIKGDRQEGAIRFSLCPENTIAQANEAADIIEELLRFLRKYRRR